MNPLLEKLGITHPIFLAPMAGVSTPALAAAVSNAGGLGSIGLGACTAEKAAEQIRHTYDQTEHPFNANLFCHRAADKDPTREQAWLSYLAPHFAALGATAPAQINEPYPTFIDNEKMLAALLQEKPPAVSFHFGLPSEAFIVALKNAGITLIATATSLEEAKLAESFGIDILVAQGIEAGGHRGVFNPDRDEELGTLALVRLLSCQSRLPIVAAGGIMDGAGIRAALSLGASAVQMGTAFILCPESAASDTYRAALQSERAQHTNITANISGRPARGITNHFYNELNLGAPPLPDYPIAYAAGKALALADAKAGTEDFAVQWAGQGAPLARALPAASLMATLVAELNATS
ncbi:nitronate monooxygenase [Microbulbifer sp. OS29]|uniref:Nitronate monooxygenase n=1 Tax=Microbulbifer okhotskensis TaxID=2926617 RepID=A0A9X2EKS6_9GAMM|nr:nitronate monooxygenase [Microbulbifer okhotskensis]MCO1334012.1 nitronate monooxygenase [Microbulbifer okhotskensis]